MSYQNEFPKDYHPSNTEASAVEAAGMSDESWHNNVCPSFTMTDTAGGLWTLWIDCLNPDWREMGDRFTMTYHQDPEDSGCEPTDVAYAGETLADALATLPKSIASVTDKAVVRFTVRGKGAFPVDMLRHDTCYPATPQDASNIEGGERVNRPVTLYGPICRGFHDAKRRVTEGRWASFGWTVTELEVQKIDL